MNKKNLVISASSKLKDEIQKVKSELEKEYNILDYPKQIEKENFLSEYKKVHKAFYNNIANTDVLLLLNEDKNGVEGYIGAAGFAEVAFAVSQNLLNNKNIEIFIYKMPSSKVQCFDEIQLWLSLGWVKIFKQ